MFESALLRALLADPGFRIPAWHLRWIVTGELCRPTPQFDRSFPLAQPHR